MASPTQRPDGRWRVQIRRKALGRHEATFDTREEADAWGRETEARLLSRALLEPAPGSGVLFETVANQYLKSRTYLEKSDSSRRRELQCSAHVLAYFKSKAIASISRHSLQEYLDKRATDRKPDGNLYSGDTIRLERAFISSVFRFALRRNLVSENPANTELELPSCHAREGRITPEQEMQLYDTAVEYVINHHRSNGNLVPWLDFVFSTGVRPGEAAKIELTWVKFEKLEIHIPRRGNKNRNARVILLADTLARALQVQHEAAKKAGAPYLFWSHTKKKGFTAYAYNQPWRKICRTAGVPDDVVPHLIRHEFISRLFETTSLSDTQVATLAGDVHVLSLEPYKHLRTNRLRPSYEEHRRAIIAMQEAAVENRIAPENDEQ